MSSTATAELNIARRLSVMAARMPDAVSVIMPGKRRSNGRRDYSRFSFRELDADSDRIARALVQLGATRDSRLVLMVRPSFDFISLVFAIFKAGAISVLIDPGMGRQHVLNCLDAIRPDGFVAISPVQAIRALVGKRYARAHVNVTVGRRWFWGGPTLRQIRRRDWSAELPLTAGDDPAAIIFTSGSTGPPKGVLYTHGNFDAQVDAIRDQYQIPEGGIDLACFPLFGLFNCAMGVTTVIPDMNSSRPASVNPANIVEAVRDCGISQSFASPAVWDRVSRFCQERGERLEGLRRVFSAGAPVSPAILARTQASIHPDGEMHTPYGATEALPVATIEAREVLEETRFATERGAGTCVGRKYAGVEWKVIRISDEPLATLDDAEELPTGEIGELIVSAPQVTSRYVTSDEATRRAKIADGARFWHRMGDVGYLDERERFWYCGRMSQRVETPAGPLFTDPLEGIFNTHPRVRRSALIGLGTPGKQKPAIVIEPIDGAYPQTEADIATFQHELRTLAAEHAKTSMIDTFLFHPAFPVDVRHNSKISREALAYWAESQLPAESVS